MTVLCAAVMLLGLMTGSVLAVEVSDEDAAKLADIKKKEANKKLPAHEHPATAGSPAPNLANQATNPISPLIQFQLQEVFNFDNYNGYGSSNNFIIQPVIPIPLKSKKVPMLITRTTIPYVTTPYLGEPVGRAKGFGDTVALGLFIVKLKKPGAQLGLGYIATIPTAGSNVFVGNGKWQAGPSAIYINMRTPTWQWGMFVHQSWSFASSGGQSDRAGVSKLALQPILTKHLKKGWYIGSPSSPQTYNFKNNKWTLALGGQVGRVMKLGTQPVKLFGEVLYNPIKGTGPTNKLLFRLNLTLLFPE